MELALRYGESPEELREAIRASSQEVDRLTQLAEDLLVIARSDRGKVPLRIERIDPTKLLASAISRFRWRAEAMHRSPAYDPDADAFLSGERLRLGQALSNMVDNALRHGRGAIRVACTGSNGSVELHVKDEGAGFPPHFLGHAFERFSRDDRGREGSGAGLGLAIVEAIARAHSGEEHLANRPGGGADVWLVVPAAEPNCRLGREPRRRRQTASPLPALARAAARGRSRGHDRNDAPSARSRDTNECRRSYGRDDVKPVGAETLNPVATVGC